MTDPATITVTVPWTPENSDAVLAAANKLFQAGKGSLFTEQQMHAQVAADPELPTDHRNDPLTTLEAGPISLEKTLADVAVREAAEATPPDADGTQYDEAESAKKPTPESRDEGERLRQRLVDSLAAVDPDLEVSYDRLAVARREFGEYKDRTRKGASERERRRTREERDADAILDALAAPPTSQEAAAFDEAPTLEDLIQELSAHLDRLMAAGGAQQTVEAAALEILREFSNKGVSCENVGAVLEADRAALIARLNE